MTHWNLKLLASRMAALGLLSCGLGAAAQAQSPLRGAWGETKPLIDLRLRSEQVEQLAAPALESANAATLRFRLGFETGKAWNTSLLAEVEAITPLVADYRADNSVPGVNTNLPVVADPEDQELNRLQLTNTSISNTTIVLGRQRINLDDQRFVGNVGWRQNEQTFDALRVINRSVSNLTLDATYLARVNRVFGPDSPQAAYEGNSTLFNAAYQWRVGKLTLFNYALDFNPLALVAPALNPARVSTDTLGVRFTGERPIGKIKLAYLASYAEQRDRGANPLQLEHDYSLLEMTTAWRQFSFGLGRELLSGDGISGFTTPLATLHKFQGWADKFLATPANGMDDRYANLAWLAKGMGRLDTLSIAAAWHDYRPAHIGGDYGDELNFSAAAKLQRLTALLKYANYRAAPATPLTLARDTRKVWVQLELAY